MATVMTLYATRIVSDIAFPLDLSHETEVCDEIELLSLPKNHAIVEALCCGFGLYLAHGRKVYLYSDREFEESVAQQPWCYEVQGVVKFYWYAQSKTIYYVLQEEGNAALLGFWFTHLMLPFYFALEQKYEMLHGGSVEVEGKAIIFLAPSMGGKSTMTDYFIGQGHTLISDDKIPTFIKNGKFMLAGAHPYHRPYRKFEELGYRVTHFSKVCKPIDVFYVLEKEESHTEVTIEEIRGFQKVYSIMPYFLYQFMFMQKKQMVYLMKMMNSIRIFRVKRPWDIEKLPEVYEAIVAHTRQLK